MRARLSRLLARLAGELLREGGGLFEQNGRRERRALGLLKKGGKAGCLVPACREGRLEARHLGRHRGAFLPEARHLRLRGLVEARPAALLLQLLAKGHEVGRERFACGLLGLHLLGEGGLAPCGGGALGRKGVLGLLLAHAGDGGGGDDGGAAGWRGGLRSAAVACAEQGREVVGRGAWAGEGAVWIGRGPHLAMPFFCWLPHIIPRRRVQGHIGFRSRTARGLSLTADVV